MRGFLFSKRSIFLMQVILLMAVLACSNKNDQPATPTPLPDELIAREAAIETALTSVSMGAPGISPVTDPHSPVAELVVYSGNGDAKPPAQELMPGERYVWIVQFEGESRSTRNFFGADEGEPYSYAVVYVDAATNSAFRSSRDFEPYFQ